MGDSNRDVFLFGAARSDGARILAAVTGVNGDNNFIVRRDGTRRRTADGLVVGRRRLTAGHHRGSVAARVFKRIARRRARTRRHYRRFDPFRYHWRRRWRRRHIGVNGKDDGIVGAILLLHRPRFTIFRQIDQQTQRLRILRRAGTNALDQIITAKLQRQPLKYAGLFDIQRHRPLTLRGEGIFRIADKT